MGVDADVDNIPPGKRSSSSFDICNGLTLVIPAIKEVACDEWVEAFASEEAARGKEKYLLLLPRLSDEADDSLSISVSPSEDGVGEEKGETADKGDAPYDFTCDPSHLC
jgi:hypothetical protein